MNGSCTVAQRSEPSATQANTGTSPAPPPPQGEHLSRPGTGSGSICSSGSATS
jgi:hypothetical protein